MFPIRDDAPRFGTPFVTVALIAVNIAVFLYQFSLAIESPGAQQTFIETFGAIPLRAEHALAGRYPLLQGVGPVFTSIFLHGGWFHLIGNMWFLWIFGDNVEDELGHFAYLLFYLACGLVASAAHIWANPESAIPAVGASGAIAGVMGAYLMRFPHARIVTLVWIVFFVTTIEVPAVLMLAYWFFIQFASGAAETGAGDSGGVAWWAHVGGFVAGAILIWTRPRRRRRQRKYQY
ncbi:MAG TPA: rhomboid family intramembrane serine protease [Bryobacterales bacterium]|nr:rhomboid family intramembrane serine protease [Bryobacterales bacterium]